MAQKNKSLAGNRKTFSSVPPTTRRFFSNVDSASRAEAISRYINIMGAGMGLSGFLALLAICIAGLWILGDQRQQKRERREREKWEQSKRDQKLLQELERKLERPD